MRGTRPHARSALAGKPPVAPGEKEHPTQFVTNNLDVCIQYACVPETYSRLHELVLTDGSLDQDANAFLPGGTTIAMRPSFNGISDYVKWSY